MNKIYLTIAVLIFSKFVIAQSPEKMSYQAVIRDVENNLISDREIGMQISILQGTTEGNAVYIETQNPITNENGLVSIEIGTGNSSYNFSEIEWSIGPYYIKTETSPTGGSNYTITGVSQLLSVPYALFSKKAGTIQGLDDISSIADFFKGNGKININGNRINIEGTETELPINNDNDSTNELQSLQIIGNELTITSGNTVNLPQIESFSGDYNDLTNKPSRIDSANVANELVLVSNSGKKFKVVVDDNGNLSTIEIINNTGTFIDPRDNQTYKWVKIGEQIWMAENLNYLPSVVGPVTESFYDPYYYVYGYDGTNVAEAKATENFATYGVLYNWSAAMAGEESSSLNPSGVQGACPSGWHLPSREEWIELGNFLGATSFAGYDNEAGGKLKEIGYTHWESPNEGATNETGFTALPGGIRSFSGDFSSMGSSSWYWCATGTSNLTYSWLCALHTNNNYITNTTTATEYGLSVRCIKD